MRNLFLLLLRFHYPIVFLILLFFSFYLLVIGNDYHKTMYFKSSGYVAGSMYKTMNEVKQYFSLKQENNRLAFENAWLRNKLSRQKELVNNVWTLYEKGVIKYHYITGIAINKSVNRQKNYITIDKGSLSGVKPEMGIISPDGIIGIVKQVSKHFATVIPLIHINSRIGARIYKSRHFGTISWDGDDYRYVRFNEIPFHVPIKKGDIIETSGFSAIFPPGLKIGIVESVSRGTDDYFLDIKVKLSTDFLKVNHITIIDNLLREEQLRLEQQLQTEEKQSNG